MSGPPFAGYDGEKCAECFGHGVACDYVGLEMRPIGVECPSCCGTGRARKRGEMRTNNQKILAEIDEISKKLHAFSEQLERIVHDLSFVREAPSKHKSSPNPGDDTPDSYRHDDNEPYRPDKWD
jgi:hypothetical protein